MKVTVNFGTVRVIVPCGGGELLVRDLMELAITRYKKATSKTPNTWVVIHNLKLGDGGILDPDDRLNDVADDREQIIAIYEEQTTPYQHHNGGDGTSASSVGTESPDIFQIEVNHNTLPNPNGGIKVADYDDVEITGSHTPSGITPLQVRRGSEPALNRLSPVSTDPDPTKRWSAAVIVGDSDHKSHVRRTNSMGQSDDEDEDEDSRGEGSGEEKSTSSRLSRSSGRLSILGSGSEMSRWAEAADRQLYKMQDGRREPSGSSGTSPDQSRDPESETSSLGDEREVTIVLKNENGPLGIHVVPDCDTEGRYRDIGLVIQNIEPGGRIDRDGRLHVGDRIVEINGKSLYHVSFNTSQEIFKDALSLEDNIRLKLVKFNGSQVRPPESLRTVGDVGGQHPPPKKPPPPVYPKPFLKDSLRKKEPEADSVALVEGEERSGLVTKVATVTPTKNVPAMSKAITTTAPLASNTRKIGRKIPIQLTKGPEGLGFSITTRDNPAGGNCPIYIKNILPQGAAIQDGRLKPGDRLLEVNGLEMTGKTQREAVALLRNTPPGGLVDLVVSRQEIDSGPIPTLPRELPPDQSDGDGIYPWKHREILTFDIPLNDTGSAGLGVSVKGKSSTGPNGPSDLGIFVKSVIHGGAASKDGRLCTNDQLVNINGISLLSMTNTQAMETLRRAMTQGEGPNALPNAITLTVARRIPSNDGLNGTLNGSGDDLSFGSGHDRSDSVISSGSSLDNLLCVSSPTKSNGNAQTPDNSTSEASETTVIFKPRSSSVDSLDRARTKPNHIVEEGALKKQLSGRNPVIDRLMGHTNGNPGTRNESYLKASHESWGGAQLQQAIYGGNDPRTRSPKQQLNGSEKVVIEDEYVNINPKMRSRTPEHILSPSPSKSKMRSAENENVQRSNHGDPETIDMSQLTLVDEDKDANFYRDGFGRQSISEKRHAQLDARNTDTYQRNKKLREQHKDKGDDSTCDLLDSTADGTDEPNGIHEPSSNDQKGNSEMERKKIDHKSHSTSQIVNGSVPNSLLRSSSAESLLRPHPVHAAVEEESESGGSSQGGPIQRGKPQAMSSRQPSVSHDHRAHQLLHQPANDDMLHAYNNKELEAKASKKKGGLFKGLGSVFKFGKHRKITQETFQKLTREQLEQEAEKLKARRAAQEEQERIQEQYKKLVEQQQKQEMNQKHSKESGPLHSNAGGPPLPEMVHHQVQHHHMDHQQQGPGGPMFASMTSPSRQERMQQLRAQHQRKHQERQGQYPKDDQEEWLENDLKQRIDLQKRPQDPESNHVRSSSFDIYKEMERPGSRRGIADPNKFSHYMNYKEIQQHLRQYQQQEQLQQQQQQQHQQQKQQAQLRYPAPPHLPIPTNSQSHPSHGQQHKGDSPHSKQPPGHREKRPISNYFEYESVQATYHAGHQTAEVNTSSLPRRPIASKSGPPPNSVTQMQHALQMPNAQGVRVKPTGYTGGGPMHPNGNDIINGYSVHPHRLHPPPVNGSNYAYTKVGHRRDNNIPGSKV